MGSHKLADVCSWSDMRSGFMFTYMPVGPKLDWEHYMPRVEWRTLVWPSHCAVRYIKKKIVKLLMFTPWTRIGEVVVELQLFLTSTLFVAERSTSWFGRFFPAFNRTLGGLQSRYWRCGDRCLYRKSNLWCVSLWSTHFTAFLIPGFFAWSNWSCKLSVKAKRHDIFVKLFKTEFHENASEFFQLLHAYRQYGNTEWL